MASGIESIDHARAVKETANLRKAADEGDAQSQFDLGIRYLHGNGVDKNERQAAEWLIAAANSGHKRAQFELSIMSSMCITDLLDRKDYEKWLRRAAEPGLVDAQHSMSRAYFFPEGGIEYDTRKGMRWLYMAAMRNHDVSQFDLGEIFLEGSRDQPRDYIRAFGATALKWWARRPNERALQGRELVRVNTQIAAQCG